MSRLALCSLVATLAAPAYGLTVDIPAMIPGDTITMTATGATSGETVYFAVSTRGMSGGPCPAELGGECLDIQNPILLGSAIADFSGAAELVLTLPDTLDTAPTVWVQVAEGGAAPAVSDVWETALGGVSSAQATTQVLGGAGYNLGSDISGVGDLDGDGDDEYMIGADGYSGDAGAAYVFNGRTIPLSSIDATTSYRLRMVGEEAWDIAGSAVASAGDVDADGTPDLLVGATYHNAGAGSPTGAAYLVLGTRTGSMSLSSAHAKFVGDERDYVGRSVAGAGDVNNDGHDDLLLGGNFGSENGTYSGVAYLVHGPVSGTQTLSSEATAIFYGEDEWDELGTAVASAGDTDGDGRDDVVLGAPNAYGLASYSGAAYLYEGITLGTHTVTDADAILACSGSYDLCGYSLDGPGDMDGDGYDDVLVGQEPSSGDEWAYLAFGPFTGTVDLDGEVSFDPDIDRYDSTGGRVRGAGDVDGDGQADVLISEGSAVALVLGPITGNIDLAAADRLLMGMGTVVGTANVDGRGGNDILLGQPSNDDGGVDAGAAWLILSSALF